MNMHLQKEKKTALLGKKPSATNDSFRSQNPFDTSLTDTYDYQPPDVLPESEIVPPLAPPVGHHFSQIQIHATIPETIQTKLTINQPGDVYEQEAERVAEQVTDTDVSALQTSTVSYDNDKRREKQSLMAKVSAPRATEETSDVPSIVHEVLNSSGQPLDASTQAFMEPHFGHDFSRVRVHTDERAVESAHAVNALAYTVGQDIAFAAGQYQPGTSEGQRLLAHELTHVVQQKSLWSGFGTQIQRQDDKSSSVKEAPVQAAGEGRSRIDRVADAFILLEEAKQLATKTPPDFVQALENVSQVNTWLQTVFSEKNIFLHFGGHAINLNTALSFKGLATGALFSLRVTLNTYIDSNMVRPMSLGKWKYEIDSIKPSREYLEIFTDERKPQESPLFQSVERAGHYAGTIALIILVPVAIGAAVAAGPAIVAAIGLEATLIAGAAGSLVTPLITLVITHPVEAILLGELGLGAIFQIGSAGGIKEYLSTFTTLPGAAQGVYDLLLVLTVAGGTRGSSSRRVNILAEPIDSSTERQTLRVKQVSPEGSEATPAATSQPSELPASPTVTRPTVASPAVESEVEPPMSKPPAVESGTEPLVSKLSTLGYQAGEGEVIGEVPEAQRPSMKPGTTPYGRAMEPLMEQMVKQRFPKTQFRIRTGPGETGVDIEWIGDEDPGFDIADFKPGTPSGVKKFTTQTGKWGARGWGSTTPRPKTLRAAFIGYNSGDGSVYIGHILDIH